MGCEKLYTGDCTLQITITASFHFVHTSKNKLLILIRIFCLSENEYLWLRTASTCILCSLMGSHKICPSSRRHYIWLVSFPASDATQLVINGFSAPRVIFGCHSTGSLLASERFERAHQGDPYILFVRTKFIHHVYDVNYILR